MATTVTGFGGETYSTAAKDEPVVSEADQVIIDDLKRAISLVQQGKPKGALQRIIDAGNELQKLYDIWG